MEAGVISKPHRLKYDVFLSFRGEDTRDNFAGHLYKALDKEVRVFLDDVGMERGHEIDPSLVAAMEDSAAAVVVLSPNYANSHWCLDELAKLCDLRSWLDRPMLPIFYKVDPSHVRKQNHHFEKHFEEHAKRFSEKEIRRWRAAMKLVGNLAGYVYRDDDSVDEDEMIRLVVKKVLAEVSNTPEKVGEYTIGLESRIDDLMNLFDIESTSGVQVLGLYGMGGIGKTTLAKAFYNKVVRNFEQRVFVSNVRERSSGHGDGLLNLQKCVIKELFRFEPQIEDVNGGRDKIKESVHEKKILVVLDDVDNVDQLNALVGERSWYGEGSLIVITTRDEEILSKLTVDQRYEVQCLTEEQALKLFSYHSLRKQEPTESLMELSKKIVQVSGNLPLAIEVFGSLLYDKKEEKEWQTQLEKLKNTQPSNLQNVLALSFESLDDEEKKVFLDIACLFLKMEITKEEFVDVLKGCGLNAEAALSVLRQKSLVKILEDDKLWMHDQIRDMGRQMVLKESPEDPGMRSRLSDRGEIMTVLNNMKGTTSIRGIVFDFKKKFVRDPTANEIASMNLHNSPSIYSVFNYVKNMFARFPAEEKPKISEITIPVDPFVPMRNLRLLQINNVELEGDIKLLPSELRWIQWKGCPLETLPPEFLARQIAVLDLSESGIRSVQSLHNYNRVDENLKVVNLRGCYSLEAIPDLSNHKALEKLILQRCVLLVKVPSSVGNLKTLLHLDFRDCSKLAEFLVDVSGLQRLEKLFLSGCSALSVLPENIGAMACLKELLLDGTAIKNLPESIYRLQKLEKLSLKGCRSIQELPLCFGMLTSLEKLYLDETALQNLPDSIGDLKNLQRLHLVRCTSLSKIPDAINKLISLKILFISGSGVRELALKQGSLPCLTDFSAGGCKLLEQVTCSVGGLNSLLKLQLDWTPIKTLPKEIGGLHFIRKLELRNCESLKTLPGSIGDMDTLHSLHLDGSNIEALPEEFGKLENLVLLGMNNCKKIKRLPNSFGDLKSLHHLYMQETTVVELPESFENLSNLMVLKMLKKPLLRKSGDDSTGTSKEPRFVLPDSFSNLSKLEELDARTWGISGKIPDVFGKLTSMRLLNLGNNYFHSLPASLRGLTNLRELSLNDCRELTSLPPLPCKLEQLNLANCFSLESISDLSNLEILHDLNLTNCKKVGDIPGLEHLRALKRLYMSGCTSCSVAVKKRLSKASLKMMRNLSLPGNRVPDWFSQGPVTFSEQPNRELKGVVLAVVVALHHDDQQQPDVVGIKAQISKLDFVVLNHTLHLSGVPRTSNDQLHICRYSHHHPMVKMLKDGYTVQVVKQEMAIKQESELKMHGIHLVYEGDDDVQGNEDKLNETHQTVSQRLANFFRSFDEGELSSEGDSTVT